MHGGGGACALGRAGVSRAGASGVQISLSQGLAGWTEGVKVVKVCEVLTSHDYSLAGDLKVLNTDAL